MLNARTVCASALPCIGSSLNESLASTLDHIVSLLQIREYHLKCRLTRLLLLQSVYVVPLMQAGRSPLRDCGTCSGRAHMPGLNPLSSRMIGLTAGPAIAGPEWMHLFAAKCRQEERWGAVLADHLRLLQASLEQQSAQDLEALRGALGCADQGGALRGAPPCRSCETAALRLAQSEAEHAGLRGAVVAAMRHLIGQQKALRQSVANISGSLACGPQVRLSWPF